MTDLENSYLELLCCLMTQKFEDSETERFETKKKNSEKILLSLKERNLWKSLSRDVPRLRLPCFKED